MYGVVLGDSGRLEPSDRETPSYAGRYDGLGVAAGLKVPKVAKVSS